MAIITKAQLREYVSTQRAMAKYGEAITTAAAEVTVFLSHSHNDTELIEGAKVLLQRQNVKVYIDFEDVDLPSTTSPETANQLRQRIRSCQKLVLVASDKAVTLSRWVPWELGFADGLRQGRHVAVIPVSEDSYWKGAEYVGLYPKIELISDQWYVLNPGAYSGPRLSDWLRN